MAYVCLDNEGKVTSIFHMPQNDPQPDGYAEIEDNDPRISDYFNKLNEINHD